MMVEVATRLNFFVNVTGIPHCSPRQLPRKSKLNYNKHCKVPFLSCIQANHEPTIYNSQQPRKLDALCMRPSYDHHGGHLLYHIATGRPITRHGKLDVLPTPKHIFDTINARGKKQNGSPLTIESKYFPTWTAAVDDQYKAEVEAQTPTNDSIVNIQPIEENQPNQNQQSSENEQSSEHAEPHQDEHSDPEETHGIDFESEELDDQMDECDSVSNALQEQALPDTQEIPQDGHFDNSTNHVEPGTDSTHDTDRETQVFDGEVSTKNVENSDTISEQDQNDASLDNDESTAPTGSVTIQDDRGRQIRRSARHMCQELNLDQNESIVITRIMNHFNVERPNIRTVRDEFNGCNSRCGKAIKAVCFLETYSLKMLEFQSKTRVIVKATFAPVPAASKTASHPMPTTRSEPPPTVRCSVTVFRTSLKPSNKTKYHLSVSAVESRDCID